MDWIKLILSVFAGLITAIPLAIELAKSVRQSVKEKNWRYLLTTVLNLMESAEDTFETGEQRKQWVLDVVQKSSDTINYDIDIDVISKLIDDICKATKVVNKRDCDK